MKFIYKNIIAICFVSVCCGGCRKFVQIDPPDTQVLSSSLFANDQTSAAAMSGLYTRMVQSGNTLFNGGITIYPGLSADELIKTPSSPAYSVFGDNAIPINNPTTNDFWGAAYSYIYNSNAIIEGVEKSSGISNSAKIQFIAEAKFVRAFTYFFLVNLFGDVPLIINTDYENNATTARTPVSQVYEQVIADLKDAQTNLAESYITTNAEPTARVRPNKWAAAALLARVYLFLQDWPAAEIAAASVINSGIYSLETIPGVFISTSNEAIWQLMGVSSNFNTFEGNQFIPPSDLVTPNFSLSPELVQAFDTADLRKLDWTATNTIDTASYTYPFKYKIRDGGSPYQEHNTVLRLAEQYLIRAEARAQQNKLAEAIDDVNMIKSRAGLSAVLPASTKAEVLNSILGERRIEFFAEWGHRWMDLKRTGQATAILSPIKGTSWQPADVLYPIPGRQILINQNLVQNPGY